MPLQESLCMPHFPGFAPYRHDTDNHVLLSTSMSILFLSYKAHMETSIRPTTVLAYLIRCQHMPGMRLFGWCVLHLVPFAKFFWVVVGLNVRNNLVLATTATITVTQFGHGHVSVENGCSLIIVDQL